jgi:glycoprotein 6-alpha-L-fucosyltransferase
VARANFISTHDPPINYLLPKIPAEFADKLVQLFEEPLVWWISVVNKNLLKYNKETMKILETTLEEIKFEKPIVGVHIESEHISLKDCMDHVNEIYDIIELTDDVKIRRVYLSTSNQDLIEKAKQSYPNYEIYSRVRGNDSETLINMKEIYILSHCDFLVGSFGSRNFRMAVYHFQNYQLDAMTRVRSIHSRYRFSDSDEANCKMIVNHKQLYVGEISAELGKTYKLTDQFNAYGVTKIQEPNSTVSGFIPAFKCTKPVPNVAGHNYV